MVLRDEDQKLSEIDGAAPVFVDQSSEDLQLLLGRVVPEGPQDCLELLSKEAATLLLMQPSPSLSKRAKASRNSSICYSVMFSKNI